MSDSTSPPPFDDLRAACERILATIDLGMPPLIDDVKALQAQCSAFIAGYDTDTKKIVKEILDAIFGAPDTEPAG